MHPDDVKKLLLANLADCEVSVDGDGRHFDITVVGSIFAGLRPVQRQQKIYAVLQDEISAGTIHAVNMKTLTPDECQ
jgi:acid stress-induced BolA-like protein IbaG/YrbA